MKSTCLLASAAVSFGSAYAQTPPVSSMADLAPLIGEWRGEARHFRPRDASLEELTETVEGACRPILDGYYIECATQWVRSDGRERAHNSYVNYNSSAGEFENLFIFRGWPVKITYPFKWNIEQNMFVGFHDDETRDGAPMRIRVEFGFSADDSEHWAREYSHVEGEAADYWPQTFEMTWKKQ